MNDYKSYKQLKQKQKAKVVEWMYKELHQFFSDNQRFPDTPDEHELLARQIFSHIPYHISFDEFYAVYDKKHSAIEQRLAEKGLPEHLIHREERRQEKLNRPAVKTEKPHRKKKKKQVFEPLLEQNDDFFFIAGYTSGGAPYGVTWEEMGLEPWEELIKILLPLPIAEKQSAFLFSAASAAIISIRRLEQKRKALCGLQVY